MAREKLGRDWRRMARVKREEVDQLLRGNLDNTGKNITETSIHSTD